MSYRGLLTIRLFTQNGAGDAYTSALLVAAMLRNTGKDVARKVIKRVDQDHHPRRDTTDKKDSNNGCKVPTKKMTPYALYMKENYMKLKEECEGDKKAIFTMCHELWENETEECKEMYARLIKEEYDDQVEASTTILSDTSMEALESNYSGVEFLNDKAANASLNLESAVQLAGLISARHVDINTRDLNHLDLSELLRQSIISLSPVPATEI